METFGKVGCFIVIAILAGLALTIGPISAHYIVLIWFGKDISWFWAFVLSLFTADSVIPAAIVTWILVHVGAINGA